ncbi:MAG: hypothetical protein ACT6TB_09170 [Sphingopyxis sp.]|jgi:hypothetical protein
MAADVGKYGGNGKRGREHRYPIDAQHILSRHPGLDPGSRFLRRQLAWISSGTPDQVRGDEGK